MPEKVSAKRGVVRAIPLGLVASVLVISIVACGKGNSPTSAMTPNAAAGQCHVICGDSSPSMYVAIAVSPSALVCGSATNLPNADDAKAQAVAACGRGDCVPVVWGRDGVASVAVDQVAYGWGWANAASSTADARAIASCESRTPSF